MHQIAPKKLYYFSLILCKPTTLSSVFKLFFIFKNLNKNFKNILSLSVRENTTVWNQDRKARKLYQGSVIWIPL